MEIAVVFFYFISDVFDHSKLTEMTMVLSCMHGPLNSNIVMFAEKRNDILSQLSHMPCYTIGEYNVDILKFNNHSQTEQFLHVMYSN